MSIENNINQPENFKPINEVSESNKSEQNTEDAYKQEIIDLSNAISADYDKSINKIHNLDDDPEKDNEFLNDYIVFKQYFGEMIRRIYSSEDRLLDEIDTKDIHQSMEYIEKLFLEDQFDIALEMLEYVIEVGKAAKNGHQNLDGAFLKLVENVWGAYVTEKLHPDTIKLHNTFLNWSINRS